MKRTLMQIYVKNSIEAVDFYIKAFNAPLVAAHKNADGTCYEHAEIDVYGQIIAVAERDCTIGDNMQFCLQFDLNEKYIVENAYNVLKENAVKMLPPDSCVWSPYVFGGIDKFGINWCVYIS